MSSITLTLKGSKNPSPIYLRFTEGKRIDIISKTGLHIAPKYWDKKYKKIRNVIDVPNRDDLNSSLSKLQITIIDKYNYDFTKGIIIDKNWLDKIISDFFSRPVKDSNSKIQTHTIYLSDYALWWIENKAPRFKVSSNRYMDERTIGQYQQAVNNVIKFDKKIKLYLKI